LIHCRDGKKFFAREIRVEKDDSWKKEILELVLTVISFVEKFTRFDNKIIVEVILQFRRICIT
jgi:hypothetical protein